MDIAARLAKPSDVQAVTMLAREGRAALEGQRGAALWLARHALVEPLDAAFSALVDASPHGALVVGTLDGLVVGFLALDVIPDPGGSAGDIVEVYVLDGVRGVGVGEAMMQRALDWVGSNGLVGLGGRALPGDRALKNYFERAGLVARLIEVYRPLEGAEEPLE